MVMSSSPVSKLVFVVSFALFGLILIIHSPFYSIDEQIIQSKIVVKNPFLDTTKYLALSECPGRLGNQIFRFPTGLGIARELNRKFYIRLTEKDADRKRIMAKVESVTRIFPKLRDTFVYLQSFNETIVTRGLDKHGRRDSRMYTPIDDLRNVSSKFLVVNDTYAQNVRYFSNYVDDIRDLLVCSEKLQKKVQEKKEEVNLAANSVVCVHSRRTDFALHNWQQSDNRTYVMIEHVVKKFESPRLLMFGDDQKFMKGMIDRLVKGHHISNDSLISTYDPEIDLCMAQDVCSTFVLTSQASTFGFWLAFITKNFDRVYYIDGESDRKFLNFRENFPLPWTPVYLI